MIFTLSRRLSNGGNWAPNSFTREQYQAHSPWDCVLTVAHYAHSSIVVAIFCLTFTSTLLGRTHNEVPSVVHITLPVLCPFARDFHYYTLMAVSAAVIPLTRISIVYLTVPLKLIQAFRISTLPPGALMESSALFAEDNSLHCSGCRPSFRERERGTPPFALGLCWYNYTNIQQRSARCLASFPRHAISRLADHPHKGHQHQTPPHVRPEHHE